MKIFVLTLLCASSLAQNLPDVLPLQSPLVKEVEPRNQKRQTPSSYSTNIVHGNSEDGQSAHSSISVNFGDKETQKKPISSAPKFHKPQISFKQNIQKQVQPQRQTVPKRQNVLVLKQNEPPQQNEAQPSQQQANIHTPQPQIHLYSTPKTIVDYAKEELPIGSPSNIQADEQSHQFSSPSQHLDTTGLLAPLLIQNQGQYLQPTNSIPNFSRQNQGNYHRGGFREKNPHQQQLFNVGYSINIMNQEPSLQFRVPHPNFRQSKIRGDIITGAHKDAVGKPSELNLVEQQPSYNTLEGPTEINHPIKVFPTSYIDVNSNVHQQPQKEERENYIWKTLSPGVEISGFVNEAEQSNNFDHEAALGKSEGFDITNAVDTEPHAVNIKPTFQEFKTKIEPEQSLYEKFYKNNPIYYKQDQQQPIKVEVYKTNKPLINDISVLPQNFDQKLVLPSFQDQKFLNFQPHNNFLQENHKPYVPQYQIHENTQEQPPKNFFRQGRVFPGATRNFGPPGGFGGFGHPYRMRFSRDGHVQYLRPPPLIYRMPKYLQ